MCLSYTISMLTTPSGGQRDSLFILYIPVCHVLFSVLLYKGVTMSPEVYAGVSRSY